MPSFIVIPSTDIDAKSPISDGLMGDIKNDLDFLLSVITARGGATIKTATGSYTAVTTKLKVTMIGGGGGGGSNGSGGFTGPGYAGGNSWFGNSGQFAQGGYGGLETGRPGATLAPSVGSNYFKSSSEGSFPGAGGIGGDSVGPKTMFNYTYPGSGTSTNGANGAVNTGAGGAGGNGSTAGAGAGQPGQVAVYWLGVTPGNSYTVTVGAGGSNKGGAANCGGNGGSGLIIIEEIG